eukprot:500987-Pleurochrysis_carterae.AAC.1
MVAELAGLMQTLAIGWNYDANRMVALITALQPEGPQPGAATTSTATSDAVPVSSCPTSTASAAAAAASAPSSSTSTASPAAAFAPAGVSVGTAAVPSRLGTGMSTSEPPPQHATAVRPPWFPQPESVPPPPPSLTG